MFDTRFIIILIDFTQLSNQIKLFSHYDQSSFFVTIYVVSLLLSFVQ